MRLDAGVPRAAPAPLVYGFARLDAWWVRRLDAAVRPALAVPRNQGRDLPLPEGVS